MRKSKYLSLFTYEFTRKTRSMIIWIVSWSLFIALIVGFYDTLVASSADFEAILSALPKELLVAFNMDVDSLTSLPGMINSRYTTFSLIIGGIWAGWLGAHMIGEDESTGALVWLVTQPISRSAIYLLKLADLILWIIVVNLVIMLITAIQIRLLTSVDTIPIEFLLCIGAGMSVYYIVCMLIGNLGTIVWSVEKGRTLAIFVVMFSYIMNVVRAFESSPDFVRYLTFSHYFNPDNIAQTNSLDSNIYVLILLALLLAFVGERLFRKRDIRE